MTAAFSLHGRRIFVAGHKGMVGSAVVRRLARIDCEILAASRCEADLTRQDATERWFETHRPDVVVAAAAKVGGIHANDSLPHDFLAQNLAIALNTIEAAFRYGAQKLLFLGSSCIYPKLAPQPIKEESLLTGALEPTNEAYAIAKIAGVKLCQALRKQHGADFVSLMPTNLYGPGDNYHPEQSHVVGALLRRFHEAVKTGAAEVVVWGSGAPRREFMFVDDLADACVFVLENYSGYDPLNCGVGHDVTIAELAQTVARVVGFRGRVVFDPGKPDGAPRKLMDSAKLAALGWRPKTGLEPGLRLAYESFCNGAGRYIDPGRAHG